MNRQTGLQAFAAVVMLASACAPVQGAGPEREPIPPSAQTMELLGEGVIFACNDIASSHNFPVEAYDICVEDLNNFIKDHGYLWPGDTIAGTRGGTPESYGHQAAFSILTEFDAMKLVNMDVTEGGMLLGDIMGSLANVRGQIAAKNPGIVR